MVNECLLINLPQWRQSSVRAWNRVYRYTQLELAPQNATRMRQEVSVLALQLLRPAVVHINTLILQQILAEPECTERMTEEDRRTLTSLIWKHVNPYGTFRLDMDSP